MPKTEQEKALENAEEIENFSLALDDHFKRRAVPEAFGATILMRVKNISQQPGMTAYKVAENITRMIAPFNQRQKDVVYELVHTFFPDLVIDLYTPRTSSLEEMAAAGVVQAISAQVIATNEAAPAGTAKDELITVPMRVLPPSRHPTRMDLEAVVPEPKIGRLPTLPVIALEDPDQKRHSDIVDEEKALADKRAAEEVAEAARQAERKARRGRARMPTAVSPLEAPSIGKADTEDLTAALDRALGSVDEERLAVAQRQAAAIGTNAASPTDDDAPVVPDEDIEFVEEDVLPGSLRPTADAVPAVNAIVDETTADPEDVPPQAPVDLRYAQQIAQSDIRGRETLAVVDDATLAAAAENARRISSQESIRPPAMDDEDGVDPKDRITAMLPVPPTPAVPDVEIEKALDPKNTPTLPPPNSADTDGEEEKA